MMVLAKLFRSACNLLFADAARPIEIISGLNLIAWASLLFGHPTIVERDTYAAFRALGPDLWSAILLAAGVYQLLCIIPHSAFGFRIMAMSIACGVWTMITVNFLSSDIQTTADANYVILSLMCAISGAYLGWKKL